MDPQRRRAGAQAAQLKRQKRSYLAKTLVLVPALIILVVAGVLAVETSEVESSVAPTGVEISQELWWLVMEETDWSVMPAAILASGEGDPVVRAALARHGVAFEDFAMTSRRLLDRAQVQELVVAPARRLEEALESFDLPRGVAAPRPPEIGGEAAYSEAAAEVWEMVNVSLKARVNGKANND